MGRAKRRRPNQRSDWVCLLCSESATRACLVPMGMEMDCAGASGAPAERPRVAGRIQRRPTSAAALWLHALSAPASSIDDDLAQDELAS
jgi:hypothetical protein